MLALPCTIILFLLGAWSGWLRGGASDRTSKAALHGAKPKSARSSPMQSLLPLAAEVGALLKSRGDTIAVAESSAGGLISAALLAAPGASAYYLGGAVIYTQQSRKALAGITDDDMPGMRASTEPYARLLASKIRAAHNATWALAETGASGPTGNRYGDAAGHACIAIVGAQTTNFTIETGSSDRAANMRKFASRALTALRDALQAPEGL